MVLDLQYTPIKSRAFINLLVLVLLINYSKQVTIVDLLQNYPVNSLRMVFVRPSLSDLFTWNFYRVWFSHLTDWLNLVFRLVRVHDKHGYDYYFLLGTTSFTFCNCT